MKKKYIKPTMDCEEFVSEEYVANCYFATYLITCRDPNSGHYLESKEITVQTESDGRLLEGESVFTTSEGEILHFEGHGDHYSELSSSIEWLGTYTSDTALTSPFTWNKDNQYFDGTIDGMNGKHESFTLTRNVNNPPTKTNAS